MGVKIESLIKEFGMEISLKNLFGKQISIDAFNVLFQFLKTIKMENGNPLKNYNGEITSHLSGLFFRNYNLIENQIKVVYVFDGKPNPLKKIEIDKRREQREINRKKFQDAQDEENDYNMFKYSSSSDETRLTSKIIEDSKYLLEIMGIPVIQAPQDGEAQATELIKNGDVWAIGSQDYDSFLFGAKRVIRNLSSTRTRTVNKRKINVPINWYKLDGTNDSILEKLNINREQLVDIGILIGVDFFKGIKNIGAQKAYRYIKEYNDIEGVIKAKKDQFNFDSLTPEFLDIVRKIFLKPNVLQQNDYKIRYKKPQFEKIYEFLVEQNDFNSDKIQQKLNRMKLRLSEKRKTSIDEFIQKFSNN